MRTDALHHNLYRLTLIRWLLLAALLASLALARLSLNLVLEYAVLLWLLAGFGLINLLTQLRLRLGSQVRQWELIAQLLADLLCLSLLLYFTGGATNPFVSYLLIPLCIAAITLPLLQMLGLTLVAVACYGLLLSSYIPADSLAAGPHSHHSGPSLHTWGMGINFVFSALIIAGFLGSMARELRVQHQALARQREKSLRAEQLIGIATFAAGSAHELSTPLAAIKIAAHEIQPEDLPADLRPELETIRHQTRVCQQALIKLREQAQEAFTHNRLAAVQWLQQVLDQFQLIHPDQPIQTRLDTLQGASLSADPTLQQSLINLLNNAIQHSQAPIELSAGLVQSTLIIDIVNFGSGPPEAVRQQWGSPFNSGKSDGLGLGVYLSNSTIERHGGQLHLVETPAGTRTRVQLPVERLP